MAIAREKREREREMRRMHLIDEAGRKRRKKAVAVKIKRDEDILGTYVHDSVRT